MAPATVTTRPAEPAVSAQDPGTGPSAFAGARIVLGVSGGIAAYKAVEICRRLVSAGAYVVPVLTEGALQFVGAATFNALASELVHTSIFSDSDPIPHTRLGQLADLVIVAPATARIIGSYAAGISSDLLVATLVATRAPVLVCPAMHTEMWEHAAIQENITTLRRRGVYILPPSAGRLAGGDVGQGRLADPAEIVAEASRILSSGHSGKKPTARDLSNRHVLITAGGTREPIDPVRYISNRSSGKQGYALAEAAVARGAAVTLVTTVRRSPFETGAPAQSTGVGSVEVVDVETAADMAEAVLSRSDAADVIVMAAAVADFRPVAAAASKLKKSDGVPEIRFEPTLDILAELGSRRGRTGSSQVLVGFAAETEAVFERAAEKLRTKQVDILVGNDVGAEGAGFSHDTNAVVIVTTDGRVDVPLTSKRAVADAVLDAAANLLTRQEDSRSRTKQD